MKSKLLKRGIFFFLTFFFGGLAAAGAMEFSYKHNAGDKYRVISTVDQNIYVNLRLSYRSEIVNRISFEVTAVNDGKASISAIVQTAEKSIALGMNRRNAQSRNFQWAKDYNYELLQDRLGYMTVGDQYYMPMIRDVPVFPNRRLNVGDTWSAPGLEVHDFRDSYGIEEPYRIPFNANYRYLGEREWQGANYHAFSVSYRVFFEPQPVSGKTYPRRIQGASDQVIYWDVDRGQAVAYEEYYRLTFNLSDGQTWEYRGSARAEVIEAPPMDREELAREIAGEVAEIPDASVRVTGEGVVISLENIQFTADSAILRPSELSKLDRIAEILARYPERDILVGGHTALAGTAAGRLQLSQERAASVAEYLISKRVRTPDRVVIHGYGSEQPLADNNTQEGMQRNRRVEIVILEN